MCELGTKHSWSLRPLNKNGVPSSRTGDGKGEHFGMERAEDRNQKEDGMRANTGGGRKQGEKQKIRANTKGKKKKKRG